MSTNIYSKKKTKHDYNCPYVLVCEGGMDLAERLLQDQKMSQSKLACAGLSDIKLLFTYLQLFQVTDKVR